MKKIKMENGAAIIVGIILLASMAPSLAISDHFKHANENVIDRNTSTTTSPRDLTLISKSSGLEVPVKEGGQTELELADMNNDGNLDILCVGDHGSPYVGTQEHGIMVWLGDGNGTWDVHQNGEFGYGGCAAGDINNDGLVDIAWGIHHNWGVTGLGDTLIGAALGDGSGTNWIPWATGLGTGGETYGMFSTDLADFNCDGFLDLASISFGNGNGYHVYKNNGDGTWNHVWALSGGNANENIETCDINSDGFPDFIGSRWATYVFLGDGSFGFTLSQNGLPSTTANGIDCGDMNNDGRDDIVIGYESSGVRCYTFEQENNQWISQSTGLPATGNYEVQFGDINGDGFLDIVAYSEPTGQVYLGDGSGNWVADATFTLPVPGYYSALRVDGDFDHDGREDILVQGEQGDFPNYQNNLWAYSPWLEPTQLSVQVQSPHGGETLRSGSIRNIHWLSAVPPSQGPATVQIQLSVTGSSGPWRTLADTLPNNGDYQWRVDGTRSEHCRIKIIVTTSSSSVSAVSPADFTILGFNVDAHGPYFGDVGALVQFTGSAANGTPPYSYLWDFGDGGTLSEQNPIHEYMNKGNYTVILTVTDNAGVIASDLTWALIRGANTPPTTPEILGPAQGKAGQPVTYSFNATDLEGDDIYYFINWGDQTNSSWLGPYSSGKAINVSHTWNKKGTYIINAKAKDIYGNESDWGSVQVKMPFSYNGPFTQFWEILFERFPHAFPILRHLLGLFQYLFSQNI